MRKKILKQVHKIKAVLASSMKVISTPNSDPLSQELELECWSRCGLIEELHKRWVQMTTRQRLFAWPHDM